MRIHQIFVVVALAGGAGCADGNEELRLIAGDWFPCTTPSCEQLASDGLRFTDDAHFYELSAKGDTYDEGEDYCAWPNMRTYTWSDGQLELLAPSKVSTFEIVGDRATSKTADGPIALFVRVDTDSDRVCNAADGPQVLSFTATPETVSRGNTTTLSWNVSRAGSVDIFSENPQRFIVFGAAPVGTQTTLIIEFETTFKLVARSKNSMIETTLIVRVPDALEKIAETPGRPSALEIDGGELFWSEVAGGVTKSALDGTGAVTVAASMMFTSFEVAAGGDELFYTELVDNFRSKIWRIGKDGSGKRELAEARLSFGGADLKIFGDYLYWAELDRLTGRVNIVRKKRDGSGGLEQVKRGLDARDAFFGFHENRVVYRDAFGDNSAYVAACELDGTNSSTIAELEDRGIGFLVDGNDLFWTTIGNAPTTQTIQVHRLDLTTREISLLGVVMSFGSLNPERPQLLADETTVYFAFPSFQWQIMSIPRAGGTPSQITTAAGGIMSLALSDTHLYWSVDQGDYGYITRWPKP